MFEQDRARGVLTDERRALVAAAAFTLVDNLSEHEDGNGEPAGQLPSRLPLPATVEPGPDWQNRPILCAGGRGNLDNVAAAILAQLLERRGIGSRVASHEALATSTYASLDMGGMQVAFLSYLNPDSIAHARYAIRRLRRRTGVPIAVAFWSPDLDDAGHPDLVTATRSDMAVTSLEDTLAWVIDLVPAAAIRSTGRSKDSGGVRPGWQI